MTLLPPHHSVGTADQRPAPYHRPGAGRERLRVTVCRSPREFAALGPDWARLHGRCASATPFQSHAWLHSWWLSYGRPGRRLRIVLVRRGGAGGELVGAAPLMRTYRPLPVLVALGGPVSDYTDVLIDDAYADEVAAALARGVRRAARGAVVDLREVRPGAAAELLYGRWRGPKRRLADSVCLELPGVPMDELIARVGSSRGQRIRSLLRKLDAAGVEERDVPAAEVPDAVAGMLRLHRSQWQGRGVTPEHLRPRFAAHLARAGREMAASGEAVVTEFRQHGRVVAANLTLLAPSLAGGYLYGADPELRGGRIDVTTLLMRHGARHAAGGGRAALSLLRGAEAYKLHWRPRQRVNQRLMLAGRLSGVRLAVRAGLAALRTAAGRSARLRAWRERVRAVGRGTARRVRP